MLGLAPSDQLSQTGSKRLLQQLLDEGAIERPIFSLMLINGHEGVLSIGGTGAQAVQMVDKQIAAELDRAGAQERVKTTVQENSETSGVGSSTLVTDDDLMNRDVKPNHKKFKRQADWEDGWTLNKVQGAEGWWQTLMHGVWVDGSKVLQNQAVVLDVRTLSD